MTWLFFPMILSLLMLPGRDQVLVEADQSAMLSTRRIVFLAFSLRRTILRMRFLFSMYSSTSFRDYCLNVDGILWRGDYR